MKEDTLNTLFKDMEGRFDVQETPSGHGTRFMERLHNTSEEQTTPTKTLQRTWWKPLSIAASIALLIALAFNFQQDEVMQADLASVSEEMETTQSFFTTTINQELATLKSYSTPETKALVNDALKQIDQLEKKYQQLKTDLVTSGNDKRVVYAMISNFQTRIDLLSQVIETLEELKTSKTYENLL